MGPQIRIYQQLQAADRHFSEGLALPIVVLYVGWLTNRQLKGAPNRSLVRSADRDSQDKDLVGSLLDRFAKTAGSRDSVDSILTHVYPYYWDKLSNKISP